eukprot:TRINITY_DN5314_c0_g1_i1.p1 TRINITY_DN5314_c0_g1~~TRINITY_DN5314_c0_g1_i1.p1  ORF type:complete len:439 (+),score=91.48 TRINITY_DN5314_c0_g1_i1:38-1354(+)
MPTCSTCSKRAILKRPKNGAFVCKECFFQQFEEEIHETIVHNHLFKKGDRVAIGASGGKDSTVLMHILWALNTRYKYGIQLLLLSIDEGIKGYRDDSLECVKRNQKRYNLPLFIVSYKDLFGWTMDEIVKEVGQTNNCTYCGVFRRQALDRGAQQIKADMIATGHNADDIAETVLLNFLRGDIARLRRCVSIVTGDGGSSGDSLMPRCKPFKYVYEKEIVMYAYHQKLDYFTTECIYAPFAYRGFARDFLKDLESVGSRSIIDIIRSGEHFVPRSSSSATTNKIAIGKCSVCGYMSSNKICKACVLLQGLNRSKPKVSISSLSLFSSVDSSSTSSSASLTPSLLVSSSLLTNLPPSVYYLSSSSAVSSISSHSSSTTSTVSSSTSTCTCTVASSFSSTSSSSTSSSSSASPLTTSFLSLFSSMHVDQKVCICKPAPRS